MRFFCVSLQRILRGLRYLISRYGVIAIQVGRKTRNVKSRVYRGGVDLVFRVFFDTLISAFAIDDGKKALLGSGFSSLIDLVFLIMSRWANVDSRPLPSDDFRP